MGRFTARSGLLALALVIGVTVAVPVAWAGSQAQPTKSAGVTLTNATSWGLISVAQSSATNVMAVGYSKAPTTAPIGELWNGTSWTVTAMPHPAGGALLYSVTNVPGSNDFIAGGEACNVTACPQAYLLEWNGSAWSTMKLPKLAGSTDIDGVSASSPTNAWAVGQTCNDIKYTCNVLILHWNGTAWSRTGTPASLKEQYPDLYGVATLSSTDAWAVGTSIFGALAINWNGRSWVNVPSPGTNGFSEGFISVSSIPGTSEIWTIEAASGGELAERWNGAAWKGSNLPTTGGQYPEDSWSDLVASSTTNAWAVGYYDSASGTQPTLIAEWNGKTWSQVKSPSTHPENELFSVTTTSPTSAVAVGVGFSEFQPTAKGLADVWNGTSWTQDKLPTPTVPSGQTPHASKLTERNKF